MNYAGPIDLDQLIDPQPLRERGECPYTFLAFPVSGVNEHGVPKDKQAQEYIAAVQAEGVPVGIWLATPVDGTAYAFVGPADIHSLHRAVEALVESQRFSEHFAAELSERLFRENSGA
jgi:hypothetical protein